MTQYKINTVFAAIWVFLVDQAAGQIIQTHFRLNHLNEKKEMQN